MSVLRVSFKGLFFDRLVANAQGSQLTPGGVGLYRARNRSYSPTLGRWLQRDPNATAQPILEAVLSNGLAFSDFALSMDVPTLYGDGMNLYQFGRSNPIANGDAMGLFNYGDHMTSIAIGQSLLGAAIGGAMGGWRGATAGVLAGFAGGVAGAAFAGSATGLLATFMFGYADGFVGGYIQSALTNRPDLQTNFNDAAESALIGMAFAGMGHLLGVYADDILRAACFETGTSVSMIDGTALPIEAIPVGAVVASAPDRPEGLDCDRTIDPTDWRMVSLAIDEAECTANTIELLRPLRWVQNSQLHEGALIRVSIPEMGIRGGARVEAIRPCPADITQLADGTVTGTYRTNEAEVVALYIDGLDEPIAATPTHPFWSTDREDWTPAGELLPGETIGTYDSHATVVAVVPRGVTTTVYNLEVYGAHTYFVSAAKAWVHNTCRVLQTGGHTITEATRRALGLTREQAKKAMEGLKEIIGEGAADHGHKIWSNGDVTNSHTGELLGNLRDFL